MYVPMKEITDRAYVGGYAVPAVLGGNESLIRAAIEAAEETNSPLIILGNFRNHPDPYFLGAMVKTLANQASVPVALVLDHSRSFEDAILGIRTGYSAIMVDRSELPLEENIAQVKELVRIAHAVGVSVEAELGHVGKGNNYEHDGYNALTSPEEAKYFVEQTGVDCLAVAIGTAHGAYPKGMKPEIRFQLLEEINKTCGIPLVLHGASGTGDDAIRKVCTMGISKVNVANDIVQAAVRAVNNHDMAGNAAYSFFATAFGGCKEEIKHLFELTGCKGKAWSEISKLTDVKKEVVAKTGTINGEPQDEKTADLFD